MLCACCGTGCKSGSHKKTGSAGFFMTVCFVWA